MREFVIIAFALTVLVGGAVLCDCTPSPKPLLEEPPITIVDASDAAALLDVGASPDLCALECASFARAGCVRAARDNCAEVCRAALQDGLLSETHVRCVANADGSREVIQGCGRACR